MQAKKVLKPTPPQTAILYRAAQYGEAAKRLQLHTFIHLLQMLRTGTVRSTVVGTTVDVTIGLASGNAISSFHHRI